MLKVKEKRRLILAAYNYNGRARNMASCNQLYMGSMETCLLFKALDGDWLKESLNAVIARATDEQLDAGLERCANIIKYGKLA